MSRLKVTSKGQSAIPAYPGAPSLKGAFRRKTAAAKAAGDRKAVR